MLPDSDQSEDREITWREVCEWIETAGRTALVMCPVLYWVNGPAVSQEQAIMRYLLWACAGMGALGPGSVRRLRTFGRQRWDGHWELPSKLEKST